MKKSLRKINELGKRVFANNTTNFSPKTMTKHSLFLLNFACLRNTVDIFLVQECLNALLCLGCAKIIKSWFIR